METKFKSLIVFLVHAVSQHESQKITAMPLLTFMSNLAALSLCPKLNLWMYHFYKNVLSLCYRLKIQKQTHYVLCFRWWPLYFLPTLHCCVKCFCSGCFVCCWSFLSDILPSSWKRTSVWDYKNKLNTKEHVRPHSIKAGFISIRPFNFIFFLSCTKYCGVTVLKARPNPPHKHSVWCCGSDRQSCDTTTPHDHQYATATGIPHPAYL